MPQTSSMLCETASVNKWTRRWSLFLCFFKRLILRRRVRRHVLEEVDGVPLVVLPDVFNPVVFRSGALLARVLGDKCVCVPDRHSDRALDMGTGSGIGAVFAARRGYRVVGVDINTAAVRCARINALVNRVEDRVEIRHGDLFHPVRDEQFDLVLFNLPFFRGQPKDAYDRAWRSEDVVVRFAKGLPATLTRTGRALVVMSSEGDQTAMLTALKDQGLKVEAVARRHYGDEILTVYSARRVGST